MYVLLFFFFSSFLTEAIPIPYWICVITLIFVSNVLEKLLNSIDCNSGFFPTDLNSICQLLIPLNSCF